MSGNSLGRRTLSGAAWLLAGTLLRGIAKLFVIAVLARLLAPEDFGLMGAAGIVIAFAELFSVSGIVYALVQRASLESIEIRVAFTANLVTGVLTGLVVLSSAQAASSFFAMPALAPVLKTLAVLFPLNATSAVASKVLERRMEFSRIARTDLYAYLLGNVAIAIPLALGGFGAWALVAAAVATSVFRNVWLLRGQYETVRLSFDFTTYRELMKTGLGFGLIRLASFVSLKGDYLVVGRMLGGAALGLYERSYVLMDLSNTMLAGPLGTVLFPAFSRLQHDVAQMRQALLRSSAMLGLIVGPASAIAWCIAPEIVTLVLGPRFGEAIPAFQILSLAIYFRAAYKVTSTFLNGVGHVYASARSQVVYAACVVAGALVGARWGVIGVATSTTISIAVFHLLLMRVASRIAQIALRSWLLALLPTLLVSSIAGTVAQLVVAALRNTAAPPVLTAIVTGASALVVCVLVAWWIPSILGRFGRTGIAALIAPLFPRMASRLVPQRTAEST